MSLNKVPTVIGISGPPRAGKDTFAAYLSEDLSESGQKMGTHRMSYPLKLLAVQMLPEQKWGTEALKDTPMNQYKTTYRDVQIELYRLGEALFGADWLGRHYVRAVYNMRHLDFILMPDCGRLADIQPLLDMEVPFFRVKIIREGTTYEGDSREDFFYQGTMTVLNNSSLESLKNNASLFAKFLLAHVRDVIAHEDLTTG